MKHALSLLPFSLTFFGAFAAASLMSAADTPAPKTLLGSTVFDWAKLQRRVTPNGERRDVANNPTATLATFESHITTLNPGQASHAPHRHPQEELIILREGTVEIHINGETQRAGAGSTFFYASNDAHAVRNVGEKPATYWVINLATVATYSADALAAGASKANRLRSQVFDWEKLAVKPTKIGEQRPVLNGPTVTLENLESHITTVNAGQASHAPHRHPDEEVILIKEGTLEVTINGAAQRAGPGSMFFFGSNDLHGMRNVGDSRATYHVIRMVTAATPKGDASKK